MTFDYTNQKSVAQNPTEYMLSGLPWITSSWAMSASTVRVDFPCVTQHVYIRNNGPGYLKYSLTQNGMYTGNYGRLEPSGTVDYRIRLKTMYFLGSTVNTEFELFGSLTTVLWEGFPVLTGSAVYPNSSSYRCYSHGILNSFNSGSGIG